MAMTASSASSKVGARGTAFATFAASLAAHGFSPRLTAAVVEGDLAGLFQADDGMAAQAAFNPLAVDVDDLEPLGACAAAIAVVAHAQVEGVAVAIDARLVYAVDPALVESVGLGHVSGTPVP